MYIIEIDDIDPNEHIKILPDTPESLDAAEVLALAQCKKSLNSNHVTMTLRTKAIYDVCLNGETVGTVFIYPHKE